MRSWGHNSMSSASMPIKSGMTENAASPISFQRKLAPWAIARHPQIISPLGIATGGVFFMNIEAWTLGILRLQYPTIIQYRPLVESQIKKAGAPIKELQLLFTFQII
jgi:hypothetical protein